MPKTSVEGRIKHRLRPIGLIKKTESIMLHRPPIFKNIAKIGAFINHIYYQIKIEHCRTVRRKRTKNFGLISLRH